MPCERGGITDPNDCLQCICPDGFGGDLCQTVGPSDPGCSPYSESRIMVDSVNETCLESPGYGEEGYEPYSECNWYLQVRSNDRS